MLNAQIPASKNGPGAGRAFSESQSGGKEHRAALAKEVGDNPGVIETFAYVGCVGGRELPASFAARTPYGFVGKVPDAKKRRFGWPPNARLWHVCAGLRHLADQRFAEITQTFLDAGSGPARGTGGGTGRRETQKVKFSKIEI